MLKKARAIMSAAKAGWIASRCEFCVIDDENREIIPCIFHRSEISRLAEINADNQPNTER